jgi:hypothetical protein
MLAELKYCSETWSLVANVTAALAYITASYMTGDAILKMKGLEIYQNALVSIQGALNKKSITFSAETIIYMAAMGLFDVSYFINYSVSVG